MMYGQTEATARMSYLPPEYLNIKIGSIGLPIPGGEFYLVDEKECIINSSFTKGELVYIGANVAMGYAATRGDLNKGDDWSGHLHTGDIAYRDDDGFYYIAGRLKRFIKIYGNRVSLDEVEVLLQMTFIENEFICFGNDDCLQVAFTGVLNAEEIIAFLSRVISVHRSAIKCNQISEIPRLNNGKINYGVLVN